MKMKQVLSFSGKNFYGWALAASLLLHGTLIAVFGDWNLLTSPLPPKKPRWIQKVKLVQTPVSVTEKTQPLANKKTKTSQTPIPKPQPPKKIQKSTQASPLKKIFPVQQPTILASQLIPVTRSTVISQKRKLFQKVQPLPYKKMFMEQKTFSMANLNPKTVHDRPRPAFQKPQQFLPASQNGTKTARRKPPPSIKVTAKVIPKVTLKMIPQAVAIHQQGTYSQAEGHAATPSSRNKITSEPIVELAPSYTGSVDYSTQMNMDNQTALLNLPTESKLIDTGEDSGIQESSSETGSGEGHSGPDLLKLKSTYVGQIRERIARFKHYPKMALRRELEGEPVLQFKLGKDGQIMDLTLSKSSGSRLLDQAAMDSVKKGAPYPIIPFALKRDFMTIQLPITFTLD